MHSIEIAEDGVAQFLLTAKMKGVETYSFFDTF
jgi:hypothetical protein